MTYLFEADELDLLRSSLELPFRKFEVLDPTYREGVTRLLSEMKKKIIDSITKKIFKN